MRRPISGRWNPRPPGRRLRPVPSFHRRGTSLARGPAEEGREERPAGPPTGHFRDGNRPARPPLCSLPCSSAGLDLRGGYSDNGAIRPPGGPPICSLCPVALEAAMKNTVFPQALMVALWLAAFPAARNPAGAQLPSPAPGPGIAASLQPFVDNHTLAGAVLLVASKDKVLSLEAVGYADVAAKRPMQTDCLFWIASHVQADHGHRADDAGGRRQGERGRSGGKVSARVQGPVSGGGTGPASRAVEEARGTRSPSATCSVTPAACRSSRPWSSRRSTCCRCAQAVRTYAVSPLQFEPDSKYQYSNAGINTAGRIIEVVSGMPYEEFLDQASLRSPGDEGHVLPAERRSNCGDWPNRTSPMPRKTGLEETPIGQLQYPLDDSPRASPCRPAACFRRRPICRCSAA